MGDEFGVLWVGCEGLGRSDRGMIGWRQRRGKTKNVCPAQPILRLATPFSSPHTQAGPHPTLCVPKCGHPTRGLGFNQSTPFRMWLALGRNPHHPRPHARSLLPKRRRHSCTSHRGCSASRARAARRRLQRTNPSRRIACATHTHFPLPMRFKSTKSVALRSRGATGVKRAMVSREKRGGERRGREATSAKR